MITTIITILIGNYFVTTFLIGLIIGFVKSRKAHPRTINITVEAYFSNYLLWAVGISNLINFVFHVFFGDMAAEFIGWAQSPFQAEVGFASLGVGIAGVLAYQASFPFRFATIIPPICFSLGAAGGHIYQMIVDNNFSPGNVGLVLPADIIIPVVGVILLWLSHKHPKLGTENQTLR
jgi:hypothetical protein